MREGVDADLYRLLCRAVSGRAGEADWAKLRVQEWKALAGLADGEGVAPLLCWRLNAQGWPEQTPPQVRSFLQQAYYNGVARSAAYQGELLRLGGALNAAGVAVWVLKGMALASTLYPDAGLRPVGDIDLLVRREAVAVVKQTMPGLGYVPERPEIWPGLSEQIQVELNYDLAGQFPVHAEIHWDVVGSEAGVSRDHVTWLLEQRVAFPGRQAAGLWIFTPTAQLLHLAAHLVLKHTPNQRRLIWYYDIALLAARLEDGVLWETVVAKAIEWGWAGALHQALVQVRDDLAAPVPEPVLAQLALAGAAGQQAVGAASAGGGTRFARQWMYLWSLPRRYRWQVLAAMFFPSAAYMRWRYGYSRPWLLPFYIVYRWVDMARDVIWTVVVRLKEKLLDSKSHAK